jgi:hypothetical protein
VIQRFQIEDLVVQDASGVVFRALDTETNQYVALRRFFPFGANGGGLNPEEQEAYNGAVARLSAVGHPSLRSVISGGCDPVDGMPFIATEWIEGTRLKVFLDQAPLNPADAISLLVQALEVCQILSEILAEEAVWIETGLQTIVVATPESGRGVTFWISPLKCLGKHDGQRGLESLVTLTESIMGWSGRPLPDQAGNGLAGWLNWLKAAPRTTSLHEARERLAGFIGAQPPVPTRKLVRHASRSGPVVRKKGSSKIPMILISCLLLLATGLGGWALVRRNNALLTKATGSPPPALDIPLITAEPTAETPEKPAAIVREEEPAPAPPEPVIPGETPQERATRRAAEMTAAAGKATEQKEADTARLREEVSKRGGVFTIADHELLLAQRGQTVTLEGTLSGFGHSSKNTTIYLQFSDKPPATEARASILLRSAGADLQQESLAPLVGKKIRVTGKVLVENFSKRPVIPIKSRSAIQEVK